MCVSVAVWKNKKYMKIYLYTIWFVLRRYLFIYFIFAVFLCTRFCCSCVLCYVRFIQFYMTWLSWLRKPNFETANERINENPYVMSDLCFRNFLVRIHFISSIFSNLNEESRKLSKNEVISERFISYNHQHV